MANAAKCTVEKGIPNISIERDVYAAVLCYRQRLMLTPLAVLSISIQSAGDRCLLSASLPSCFLR